MKNTIKMLRIVVVTAALSSIASASPVYLNTRPDPRHTSSLPYRTSSLPRRTQSPSLPYRGYRSVPVGPYHPPPPPYHAPAPAPYRPAPPKPYHPAPKPHGGPEYRDPYHEDGPGTRFNQNIP